MSSLTATGLSYLLEKIKNWVLKVVDDLEKRINSPQVIRLTHLSSELIPLYNNKIIVLTDNPTSLNLYYLNEVVDPIKNVTIIFTLKNGMENVFLQKKYNYYNTDAPELTPGDDSIYILKINDLFTYRTLDLRKYNIDVQ